MMKNHVAFTRACRAILRVAFTRACRAISMLILLTTFSTLFLAPEAAVAGTHGGDVLVVRYACLVGGREAGTAPTSAGVLSRKELVEVEGQPYGLSEAAVAAVRTWRFQPALYEGEPTAVFYMLTINFRLQ